MARRLAALGARVLATDFSENFLQRARARSGDLAARIDYRLADATDEGQLLALVGEPFDAAVCNMALMDMPTIEPLLKTLPGLLKPAGRFVFSVPHPAFNLNSTVLMVEEEDRAGALVETYSVKLRNYLRVPLGKGAGMPNEPAPHWYFHRPLHELFGACFAAGFVLNGLEEPSFPLEEHGARALSWINFKDIPPALVARMKVTGPRVQVDKVQGDTLTGGSLRM